MARRRNKGEERHIAAARVATLFDRARTEALGPDADLADRHAALARRIAMRYRLRLRRDQKAQVCRKCDAYRSPANSRSRVHRGRLVTTCLRCGHIHRRPLKIHEDQGTA